MRVCTDAVTEMIYGASCLHVNYIMRYNKIEVRKKITFHIFQR